MKKAEIFSRKLNTVPDWFFQWVKILYNIKSDTCDKIDSLLSSWDLYWAVELFEEETEYNPTRVWH